MNQALITDFFGGVAQVEIMTPQEDVVSGSSSEPDAPMPGIKIATAVQAEPIRWERETVMPSVWKKSRAWASFGALGLLVGWVCSR
jgi:phosphatidylinositol glycan class K